MKKTLLKLTAIITMLCAFSGCDALLSSLMNGEQEEQEKEQPDSQKEKDDNVGEETKVPTSLADLVGTSFIFREDPNWMYVYVYVKDSKTLTFVINNPNNEDSKYYSYDSEVDEEGRFYADEIGRPSVMKIVDGRWFFYFSEASSDGDSWACEKDDESEGLIGSWMYLEEWPYSKKYVVTEDKITQYRVDKEERTTEEKWSKTYTLKNGLLFDSDNNIIAYYDGKILHTQGINEFTKITDSAKAKEIKNAALGDEYKDDDEGGIGEGGENEGETTIPKTFEECIGTYHYWKDYYYGETEYIAYIKDSRTIILYNIADKSIKTSTNYGEGFEDFMPWDLAIDVRPNGELVCYRTMFDHAIKTDDKEGLYGNWIDQTEQGHEFVIDENTVNGVKYVNKSNFLDFEDNSYSYDLYYDGEYLWTEGAGEFKRIPEKDLESEVKDAIQNYMK